MRSDDQLLEAWRNGDQDSGRILFERYISTLSRFFRTKVGEEREDLIQLTFLACVESRDRLRDGTRFRAYLFRIARNKLYDHLLAVRRGTTRPDPLTHSVIDLGASPSRLMAKSERDQHLFAALQHLPLDLQILLELHYWEGMSTAGLAEVLQIPQGTVKTRLFRARGLLREQLARLAERGSVPPNSLDGLDAWARSLGDWS